MHLPFIFTAISFPMSKHFRLSGTGEASETYGIVIQNSSFGVLLASGPSSFPLFKTPSLSLPVPTPLLTLAVTSFLPSGATNFEVDHLWIMDTRGHAAISCKSDPTSDGGIWVASLFTMYCF